MKTTRGSVLILLLIMVLVAFVGHQSRVIEIKTNEIKLYREQIDIRDEKIEQLTKENEKLSILARMTDIEAKQVKLNESQIKYLISILFPKQDQDKFLKILKCENGGFDSRKVNLNKNGTVDLGIAQINQIHTQRINKIFSRDFYVAMADPLYNLVFSVIKWKEEGARPWTCNKAVAQGGKY